MSRRARSWHTTHVLTARCYMHHCRPVSPCSAAVQVIQPACQVLVHIPHGALCLSTPATLGSAKASGRPNTLRSPGACAVNRNCTSMHPPLQSAVLRCCSCKCTKACLSTPEAPQLAECNSQGKPGRLLGMHFATRGLGQ